MSEESIIKTGSRVKALKDLRHNRNPFKPDFDIPKGTCGTVTNTMTASRVEGSILFFVLWDIKHAFKNHSCISSEIEIDK